MAEALAQITPVDGLGMISIRADLARCGDAIAEAAGVPIPETTRITSDGRICLGWMSHDELLVTLPHEDVRQMITDLEQALTGEHMLVADVSDMRAVFDVTGQAPEQVLAKLCPIDFATMPVDGMRRTRAAQTALGLWRHANGFRVIGFRSTADYLRLILENAAIPGSGLDPR